MKLSLAALGFLIALPVMAQERPPAQRQVLIELSRVIGQSHAIRQVCHGPDDAFWRDRMMSMLETEDADHAFSERLRSAFNAGFLEGKQRHPACNRITREDEARLSAQGQAFARRLAAPAPTAEPKP